MNFEGALTPSATFHVFPGGRHLVSVSTGTTPEGGPDELLDIRDVATGKPAVFFRGLSWAGAAIIEPTPDGEGFLMGERLVHTGGRADSGRVRHFGFDGTLRETWELDETPSTILAPAGGQGFWAGGYSKARWYALKSRP